LKPDVSETVELPPGALEALIAWIPAAVVMVDHTQHITAATPSAGELFGYPPQEMIGRPLTDLVPVNARSFHDQAAAAYVERPYIRHPDSGLQLTALHRDGTEFPVDISLNTVRYRDGVRTMAVVSKASDRAERQVADQRRKHMVDFLSAVSHDLRTPLNAVLGFSELLASGSHGSLTDRQRRDVDNIQTAGNNMLMLLNDVLDLQRVEAGEIQLLWEKVPVDTIVDEAVTLEEPEATTKGLLLEWIGRRGLHVMADQRRIRQILGNLLSNAVKYTDLGKVSVSAEQHRNQVAISVTDTGPGIPEADLKQIYNPFFQGSLALRQAKSGSGLGLALTRRLVEALNGEIHLESTVGLGTTATVRLPAA